MYKRIFLGLVLLFVGIGIAMMGCETAHTKGAKIHIKYGRWEQAKQQLLLAQEKEPQNAEVYLLLGKCAAHDENYEEMNKQFDKAVYLDSKLKTQIEEEKKQLFAKQFNRGVELYNRALKLDKPEQKEQRIENLNSAVKPLMVAVRINPVESKVLEIVGNIYTALNEPDQARKTFEDLLKSNPENAAALENLGRMDIAQGFKEKDNAELRKELIAKGVTYLEKYMLLKPDDVNTMRNLALAYTTLERKEDAKNLFEKAIAKNPKDPDLHAFLGNTLSSLGQKEEALKEFKIVEQLAPKNLESLLNIAQFYLDAKDWDQAMPYLQKALQIAPDNGAVWYNLGIVYGQKGQTKEAEEAFKKAEEFEKKK